MQRRKQIEKQAKKCLNLNVTMEKIKSRAVQALRWSEKYTKTDMVYLAKGGFWLGFGQVIGSLIAFATSVAFANLLSPEVYGEYRYVISALNILSISTLTGINTSLMKSVAQGFDESVLPALKARLSWSAFGSAGGMLAALYYLIQGNDSLAFGFLIISFFIPLFYSFEIYGSILKGKKMFEKLTMYSTVTIAVSSASLVLVMFFSKNIALLLVSYFFPYTALKALFFYITVKKNTHNKAGADPETVSYGKHLSLISAISDISGEIDKFLLWHFLGPVQLAVYSFAIAPVQQLNTIKSHLKPMIFPKIAEQDFSYVKKVVYSKMFRFLLLMACIVIVYMVCAPFLYKLVFPQYIESINYSRLFSLTLLFTPLVFISTAFSAHSKLKEQYYLNIIPAAIRIILFLILTPVYGIWGIIVSFLIVNIISLAVQLFLFIRAK